MARDKTFLEERRWIKVNPYPESARMTDEELIRKFKNNASRVLSREKLDYAVKAIMEVEKLDSIGGLIEAITM